LPWPPACRPRRLVQVILIAAEARRMRDWCRGAARPHGWVIQGREAPLGSPEWGCLFTACRWADPKHGKPKPALNLSIEAGVERWRENLYWERRETGKEQVV
jgi:hypothetical protein